MARGTLFGRAGSPNSLEPAGKKTLHISFQILTRVSTTTIVYARRLTRGNSSSLPLSQIVTGVRRFALTSFQVLTRA